MAAYKAIIITTVPKCDGSVGTQVGMQMEAVNSVLRFNNNVAVANKVAIPKLSSVANKVAIPKLSSVKYTGCEDSQVSVPNRKRKLDHLTLEEKLQRKKLKNRETAQSSRDRKKARLNDLEAEVKALKRKKTRLDDLESEVIDLKRKKARLDDLEIEAKALKEKNEALTLQCHNLHLEKNNLHLEKTRLATENQQLLQKLSNRAGTTAGSGPEASGSDCVDNHEILPPVPDNLDSLDGDEILSPVPDNLDSLDGDVSLSFLDELVQSLLGEAAEEMDTEHRQANAEVGTYGCQGKSSCYKVVGSSPEDVETNKELITSTSLKFTEQGKATSLGIPDIRDSSLYLLPNQKDTCDTSPESVFGMYNEFSHTITIVIPQEDVVLRMQFRRWKLVTLYQYQLQYFALCHAKMNQ